MKAYLNNISPAWPLRRQEDVLRAAIPGWPKSVDVRRDVLDSKQLMANRPASLVELGKLLARHSFRRADTINVASLAVLGWRDSELIRHLLAATALGITVKARDIGLEIGPDATPAVMKRAVDAFLAAREKVRQGKRGEAGGQASGAVRRSAAGEKVKTIAKFWKDPKETRTDRELAVIAGVSVNTVKEHLGPRPNRRKIKAARNAAEQQEKRDE